MDVRINCVFKVDMEVTSEEEGNGNFKVEGKKENFFLNIVLFGLEISVFSREENIVDLNKVLGDGLDTKIKNSFRNKEKSNFLEVVNLGDNVLLDSRKVF